MTNKKTCEHKCEQCVRAEIAKLEEKIKELKKQLPPDNIIYIDKYIQPKPIMPLAPQWYCGDPNIVLCSGISTTFNSTRI